jgi:hypothetical protein
MLLTLVKSGTDTVVAVYAALPTCFGREGVSEVSGHPSSRTSVTYRAADAECPVATIRCSM